MNITDAIFKTKIITSITVSHEKEVIVCPRNGNTQNRGKCPPLNTSGKNDKEDR